MISRPPAGPMNGPYAANISQYPYAARRSPPGSPSCCYNKAPDDSGGKQRDSFFGSCCSSCCCCPADSNSTSKQSTSLLATLAVCFLVLAYTVLGAFVFMSLEGHKDVLLKRDPVTELRARTVERLWSITENLNILYRENWTRLAAEEVFEFQESLFRQIQQTGLQIHQRNHRWTFSSSFLYSLTVITTIGYGSVWPRSSWGKVATIFYALVGIPLMLLYLSTTGDILARSFRRLYGRLCGLHKPPKRCNTCNGNSGHHRIRVPVTLCFVLLSAYVACGALLFHRLENWTLLESSYFCFTSLGTIGFGDLLPGQRSSESSCACALYILTGMALVAMCFSLLQDEVLALLRLVGANCVGAAADDAS